jgi:hypothetical protein
MASSDLTSPSQDQDPDRERRGITIPVDCRFYLASNGELKSPVLILPWGDTAPAGLHGTLADTGLFCGHSEDGKLTTDGRKLGLPELPECYIYS